MKSNLIDLVALWHRLPTEVQARIGSAAIAAELCWDGAGMPPPDHPNRKEDRDRWYHDTNRFERAAAIAQGLLQDALAENASESYMDNGVPFHVDLNSLGIRQCTACGCTDQHGCPGGCTWLGPALCSACITPGPEMPDAA